MKSDSTRKRHGNAALLAARRTLCRFKCSIEVCERRTGAIKEAAAGIRQLDTARHAAEQLQIDLLLDRLDEAAERRLRNTKPLRRRVMCPSSATATRQRRCLSSIVIT